MLRSSRRRMLRNVVLGTSALILAAVLLAGLLRQRQESHESETHEHALLQTPAQEVI